MSGGRFAVLGAGPAGLMAAWALIQKGERVDVYDAKHDLTALKKSAGVFLLHEACGLPVDFRHVAVNGFGGGAEDYSQKVYGERGIPNSFPAKERVEVAYNMSQALDLLCDIIPEDWRFTRQLDVRGILQLRKSYQCVISTIPRSIIQPEYAAHARTAYAKVSTAPPGESYMLYNANPHIYWYRAAAAFGTFTLEAATKPGPDWRAVTKVTLPRGAFKQNVPGIFFAGRFGAWDKDKQVHDVYRDVGEWYVRGERDGWK